MIKRYNDYIRENILDPWGEEIWGGEIVGYFVADRKAMFNKAYADEFIKNDNPKIHKNPIDAIRERALKIKDDYSNCVFVLYDSGDVERLE